MPLIEPRIKLPTADFTIEPENPVAGLPVTFINQSADASIFSWDFGNGETSEEKQPTITYKEPGIYTVELLARQGLRSSRKSIGVLVTR